MRDSYHLRIAAAFAAASFAVFSVPCFAAGSPHARNLNDFTLTEIVGEIGCLPHDPVTQSTSTPKTAVRDGVSDIEAGHCIRAVADFQVAIDANAADTDALWRQEIVAYREASLTDDAGLSDKLLETAYHDMDLAIAATPKNPVFYLMRSSTRLQLLRYHIRTKNAFAMTKYMNQEHQHSYDDLTSAIAIAPQYGEAYAYRYLVDQFRHDNESAAYDIDKAQKLNPKSARESQEMYEIGQQQKAQYEAESARRSMAMANAMMGVAAAAGGGYVVPIEQAH